FCNSQSKLFLSSCSNCGMRGLLATLMTACSKIPENLKPINIFLKISRWLGGVPLSACFFHIGLLLQGLMLADYNSVANHFRFI
uniref:Uncharacterized protein n=1 Tax=Chelonoidis abingdonii TaxID=106734 RepID=A0A8C0GTC0_CHEAB